MSTRRATRTSVTRTSSTTTSTRRSRHDAAIDGENEEYEDGVQVEGEESVSGEDAEGDAPGEPMSESEDGPTTTPARRTAGLDESFEDTPTRLSRLDEKSELQGLNKRLEFYILNRRERDASADAWGRELTNLKNKHAADLEHQKNLFENQLQMVRKNRDELSAKLSQAEGENAHKDNLLTELQSRLSTEHKARTSLESRVDTLSKELVTSQSTIHTLTNKLNHLQHEYDALKSSHDDLEAGLDASRAAHEQAQSKAIKLQQQYADLSDEYDTLQARYSADGKKYDKQIHELCQENNKSVESIRSECEHRLNALFAERQYQYDKDKTDSLAELKSSYDTKLHGYRMRLEELGHELEQEKSAHRSVSRNLEKELKYAEGLRAELALLQQRISSLEKDLVAEKSNPDLLKQLHEKNETIKRIKVAFKRKDAEFDELMDVKIMLDLEIKSYRSLLDQEDQRLGALSYTHTMATRKSITNTTRVVEESTSESSSAEESKSSSRQQEEEEESSRVSKKRRRTPSVSVPRRKSTRGNVNADVTEGRSKNAALLFSRNDGEYQYVAMTNNSGQSAALGGWLLRAPRHGVTFSFPSVSLESGATFYVVTSREKAPASSDLGEQDRVAAWPKSIEWDLDNEDVAELVAPSGVVVASVVVAASGEEESTSVTGKTTGANPNQCAIM